MEADISTTTIRSHLSVEEPGLPLKCDMPSDRLFWVSSWFLKGFEISPHEGHRR